MNKKLWIDGGIVLLLSVFAAETLTRFGTTVDGIIVGIVGILLFLRQSLKKEAPEASPKMQAKLAGSEVVVSTHDDGMVKGRIAPLNHPKTISGFLLLLDAIPATEDDDEDGPGHKFNDEDIVDFMHIDECMVSRIESVNLDKVSS